MSKFFSKTLSGLKPYVPGEQPQDLQYTKLNTNESPFVPSGAALSYAENHLRKLNLYPDPECTEVRSILAETYKVTPDRVAVSNGSDEVLYFAFKAFCDKDTPAAFADITYGCYSVFASANCIPYKEIPLRADFTIELGDYPEGSYTYIIANPNAPTGIALPVSEIEAFVKAHPGNVVIIDEAYVDFGGESCIPLTDKYDNILVVQTFSKSRSMAGARFGFAIGGRDIITDINTIRNSFNPYNINSMTMATAIGTLKDPEYTAANCGTIIKNREYTVDELKKLGFEVLPSKANFIFARTDRIPGGDLYLKLKAKGVLIRHFTKDRIADYNRITIGTKEQMDILLNAIGEIFAEEKA